MQRLLPLALTAILTFAAIGCEKSQTVKDSWKFTTRQYRTYLNTPASVDLANKGSSEAYELALGEVALSVDMELQKLVRAMENSDHNPDQNWVMSMMSRFPWLSGVALVDGSGAIVSRYPEISSRELDFTPLLQPDPKQRPGALRAYSQSGEGAEIYLANPVFGGDEMRGLIVAHFDARTLATMSGDPGSFMIVSPSGVLWPGNYSSQGGAVASVDWARLLASKSSGIVGEKGSEFFWTTRYLGNLPLVYAMSTSATPQIGGDVAASDGMPEGQGGMASGNAVSQEALEAPVESGPAAAGSLEGSAQPFPAASSGGMSEGQGGMAPGNVVSQEPQEASVESGPAAADVL